MSTPEQTPEAVAVRTEVGKIQTDPTHPLHAGFKSNSKEYNAHVDSLYAKLAAGKPPVEIGGTVKVGETSDQRNAEDAAAVADYAAEAAEVHATLTKEWGDKHDAYHTIARSTAMEFIAGAGGDEQMLDAVAEAFLKVNGPVAGVKLMKGLLAVGLARRGAGKET